MKINKPKTTSKGTQHFPSPLMFILKSYYSFVTQYRKPTSIFSTVNNSIVDNYSKVFISVGKCDKSCMHDYYRMTTKPQPPPLDCVPEGFWKTAREESAPVSMQLSGPKYSIWRDERVAWVLESHRPGSIPASMSFDLTAAFFVLQFSQLQNRHNNKSWQGWSED